MKTLKNIIAAVVITGVSGTICGQPALAQNTSPDTTNLNQVIRSESAALGGLTKDLGPELGQVGNLAGQMGDTHFNQQVQQLQGSGQSVTCSNNMRAELSSLAKQVCHIPGLGQMLSGLQSLPNSKLQRPTVVSKLWPQLSINASNSGSLSDMNAISQMCGISGGAGNQAIQSELKSAGTVMPAAIQNMQQENQEINQLLKE